MNMVGFPIELGQLHVEVIADFAHGRFTRRKKLACEHGLAVFRSEDQMSVQVRHNASAASNIGVGFPSR